MQGLRVLYARTGRAAEWSRLVEEIVPDFVDPVTEGPLPGKEEDWNLVTEYRVRLAIEARRWEEAERLHSFHVDWNRQRAAVTLAKSRQAWTAAERNTVRTLATSLHTLSEIQREQRLARCVEGYREALSVAELIQDSRGAAICAFNLGNAYIEVAEIRDLALAERWFRHSLELHAKEDHIGRARCLVRLGSVDWERFSDARNANQPFEECAGHLSKSENYYRQALEMFPKNAVGDLASTHNYLGNIYQVAGQIDTALRHYRESVRYCETTKDRLQAGEARRNAAIALTHAGRFTEARDWAESALRDFEACENVDQHIVKTLKLLEQIVSRLRATSPPS